MLLRKNWRQYITVLEERHYMTHIIITEFKINISHVLRIRDDIKKIDYFWEKGPEIQDVEIKIVTLRD